MTYFRTGMTALSSAQRCFTVLFGMGRGGASALWSPRIRCVDRLPVFTGERATAFWEEVKTVSVVLTIKLYCVAFGYNAYLKVIESSLTGN